MREELITAYIDHTMVAILPKNGHFPRDCAPEAARGPQSQMREASDLRGSTIVLETIDSSPCRRHVTLASHHCYSVVWL